MVGGCVGFDRPRLPQPGENLKNKQGAIKDSAPLEEREIKGL
jgi:hypothetical protein